MGRFLTDPKRIPIKAPIASHLFDSDPGMVPIVNAPDLFYLDAPLVWESSTLRITVPPGFISDDASVPKILDWIPFLDRQGLSRRPGLAHDCLYALGRSKGKEWCDLMLETFCLSEGMNTFQAACYYQGVHLFGESAWVNDSRAGVYGAITSGDFITQAYYDQWKAAGGTIFQ